MIPTNLTKVEALELLFMLNFTMTFPYKIDSISKFLVEYQIIFRIMGIYDSWSKIDGIYSRQEKLIGSLLVELVWFVVLSLCGDCCEGPGEQPGMTTLDEITCAGVVSYSGTPLL